MPNIIMYTELFDDMIGEIMTERDIPYKAAKWIVLKEFEKRKEQNDIIREIAKEKERKRQDQIWLEEEQSRRQGEKPLLRRMLESLDELIGKIVGLVR